MENEPEGDPKASEAQQPPSAPVIPEGEAPDCQGTTEEGNNKTKLPEEQLDRDLVRWTRALAIFTGVLVVASVLQFWVMRGQLDEMKATREGGDKSMTDQLAVMRDQAKAMQGQLDQMALTERAWLLIDRLSVLQIQVFAMGPGISVATSYRVTNIGHSPATKIAIHTSLVLKGIDAFDESTVHALCKQETTDEWPLPAFFSTTILPGQSKIIEGFSTKPASFERTIAGLKNETVPGWHEPVFFC